MRKVAQLLVFFVLVPWLSWAQNSLFIQSVDSFPSAPADTVYEGTAYSFSFVVNNGTNTQLTGNLDINFRVDSIQSVVGTLAQVNMSQGDTVMVFINSYNFPTPQFKAGNNIVVVWPSVNSGTVGVFSDSVYLDVYYVPLNAVEDPEIKDLQLSLYPNPAAGEILLGEVPGYVSGYVRIYDTRGRLVYDRFFDHRAILIPSLSKGLYILEFRSTRFTYRGKFIKE
jgi:hypothetical protein